MQDRRLRGLRQNPKKTMSVSVLDVPYAQADGTHHQKQRDAQGGNYRTDMVLLGYRINGDTEDGASKGDHKGHQAHGNGNIPSSKLGPILGIAGVIWSIKFDQITFLIRLWI